MRGTAIPARFASTACDSSCTRTDANRSRAATTPRVQAQGPRTGGSVSGKYPVARLQTTMKKMNSQLGSISTRIPAIRIRL